MAIKTQDSGFRHPETAAHLQSLTDEETAQLPLYFSQHLMAR